MNGYCQLVESRSEKRLVQWPLSPLVCQGNAGWEEKEQGSTYDPKLIVGGSESSDQSEVEVEIFPG